VVLRQDHAPGEKLFVDYAEATIPIHDPTGEPERQASIFVAVLGASNYTYAEATVSQELEHWIGSYIRAFEFLGGVPKLVIPDNTRTGVNRACRYEPDLNRTYHELAMHYGVGVLPTRPYKPRDKTYVSYCTSLRSCNSESRMLGTSTPVSLKNCVFLKGFVQTAPVVIVAVFSQQALPSPSVDRCATHTVPRAHLLGREQASGSQPTVAALQSKRLPNMSDLLEIEWLVLPSPPALSIQNLRDLSVAVMIQQGVNLGDGFLLRYPNLSDR